MRERRCRNRRVGPKLNGNRVGQATQALIGQVGLLNEKECSGWRETLGYIVGVAHHTVERIAVIRFPLHGNRSPNWPGHLASLRWAKINGLGFQIRVELSGGQISIGWIGPVIEPFENGGKSAGIGCVRGGSQPQLTQIVQAGCGLTARSDPLQSWKQQCSQDENNSDYYQKFEQSKSAGLGLRCFVSSPSNAQSASKQCQP